MISVVTQLCLNECLYRVPDQGSQEPVLKLLPGCNISVTYFVHVTRFRPHARVENTSLSYLLGKTFGTHSLMEVIFQVPKCPNKLTWTSCTNTQCYGINNQLRSWAACYETVLILGLINWKTLEKTLEKTGKLLILQGGVPHIASLVELSVVLIYAAKVSQPVCYSDSTQKQIFIMNVMLHRCKELLQIV